MTICAQFLPSSTCLEAGPKLVPESGKVPYCPFLSVLSGASPPLPCHRPLPTTTTVPSPRAAPALVQLGCGELGSVQDSGSVPGEPSNSDTRWLPPQIPQVFAAKSGAGSKEGTHPLLLGLSAQPVWRGARAALDLPPDPCPKGTVVAAGRGGGEMGEEVLLSMERTGVVPSMGGRFLPDSGT